MPKFKIVLRKNELRRTILLRVLFFTILLFISTFALYLIDHFTQIEYVKLFSSVAILVILVLTFQYLLYAMSFRKDISFNNFKDTLQGLELADVKNDIRLHPIKFLFPEFEIFYQSQDYLIDRQNSEKLYELAEKNINETNAKKIEDDFKEFIDYNLKTLITYDLVIKMKRKGKAIFDDIIEDENFPGLEKLIQYTNSNVYYNTPKIEGRKILIFDDSIHYGKSARKIINLLKKIGYEKILFLTVVSQEESLKLLKEEYTDNENIFFLQYKTTNEEEYKKFYADYMIGYLDHVNKSLESDHTLIKLKIDTFIEKEQFIKLFDGKRDYVYEVERFVEKNNEYKISLECPWIYNRMNKSFFNNIRMDMVKVRFFIKLNPPNKIYPLGTTDINLSPALIPSEFNQDFCKKPKNEVCNLDKIINLIKSKSEDGEIPEDLKDLICINCIISNLTGNFVNDFMEYFEKKLKENKSEIIEKNIILPYPNEIYGLDF
jgi:hypoxanthine phosphoribosyltransferase